MNFKLSKSVKKISTIGLLIVMLVSALGLIITYINPKKIMQEQDLYELSFTPHANYEVHLVNNNLYEQSPLGEDKNYFSSLIQFIRPSFGFTIGTTQEAQFTGEYELVAEVRGYTIQGDNKEIVWNKKYPLSEKTTFEGAGQQWQEEQQVDVDFHSYNRFVQDVGQALNVNLPTELRLLMQGQVRIEVEGKVVEKPIEIAMSMPLEQHYFKIEKQDMEPIQEVIKQEVEVKVSPSLAQTVGLLVLIVLGAVGLVVLKKYTGEATKEDIKKSETKKFFARYGERMVAVQEINEQLYTETYRVMNMDDLIKIADELERPILYTHSRHLENIKKFCLMAGQTLYYYEMSGVGAGAQEEYSVKIEQDLQSEQSKQEWM